MAEFIESKNGVKSRKPHRCYMCGEPIERATLYDRYTYAGGGEIIVMHMHPECNEATADWKVDDWETFLEGDMERCTNPESGL